LPLPPMIGLCSIRLAFLFFSLLAYEISTRGFGRAQRLHGHTSSPSQQFSELLFALHPALVERRTRTSGVSMTDGSEDEDEFSFQLSDLANILEKRNAEDAEFQVDSFRMALEKIFEVSPDFFGNLVLHDARLVQGTSVVLGGGVLKTLLMLLQDFHDGLEDMPYKDDFQINTSKLGSGVNSSLLVNWMLKVGVFRSKSDETLLKRTGGLDDIVSLWKNALLPDERARKLYSLPLVFKGQFLCDFDLEGKAASVNIAEWSMNGNGLLLPETGASEDLLDKKKASEWAKGIFFPSLAE